MCSEIEKLLKENEELRKEIEVQQWACRKTNEEVKILYKELEAQNVKLKELDQVKSDFISHISHELRTPMTTVRETLSLILDGVLGETTEKQTKFIRRCLHEIDWLTRMINEILDLSKMEAGKIKLEKEFVNIVEIAKDAANSFFAMAKNKEIEIKVLNNESLNLYADKDKLTQVITNLLGNAVKYTEKGTIEIGAKDMGEFIECFVNDSGLGIKAEDLEKVFDKFYQLKESFTYPTKGTGLGLSIVKGIVEMHGGLVWAESKVGAGSKFTFKIPKGRLGEVVYQEIYQRIISAAPREEKIVIFVHRFSDCSNDKDNAQAQKIDIEAVLSEYKKYVEPDGFAARHNDDEIVVCMGYNILDNGVKADKLARAAKDVLYRGCPDGQFDFSCGSSVYPDDGCCSAELINKAAKALTSDRQRRTGKTN
ncbi:MAG: ATP-binding protein [Candidatus Omnitrophota bacterium]